MAQIIVAADPKNGGFGMAEETLHERITEQDLKSDHYIELLTERLGWAVLDAVEVEQAADPKLRS